MGKENVRSDLSQGYPFQLFAGCSNGPDALFFRAGSQRYLMAPHANVNSRQCCLRLSLDAGMAIDASDPIADVFGVVKNDRLCRRGAMETSVSCSANGKKQKEASHSVRHSARPR